MIRATLSIIIATSVFAMSGLATAVQADDKPPIKLTLHPAAEPSPALKYRLLPPASNQTSGNAAVSYGKVTAEQMTFFKKFVYNDDDPIDAWQKMPLKKIRHEKLPLPTSSIFFLEQAAKCKYCDWQLPFGEMPFYTIMLPEAQQSRSYSRILAVKARIEIANGKFEDAIKTFQTNYALAANIAKGETLVNGLIGIAIDGLMVPQINEYVQQPGAPNLYWALTLLPTPLIDMRPALDVESNSIELSFPEFRDLSSSERTADQWRDAFHRFAKQVIDELTSNGESKPQRLSPDELDTVCKQVLPIAKRALIERGQSAKKVEAMSTHQVVLMYWLQLHHDLTDEYVKTYSLPYPQAMQGIKAAGALAEQAKSEGRELIPLASLLMPVMEATRSAVARGDREIAVLRVIESLRMYAASHDGKLPEQLSDISEVPIPNDPVTTKPFEYRRDGDKAVLQGPMLKETPLNYEITIAPVK